MMMLIEAEQIFDKTFSYDEIKIKPTLGNEV